MASEALLRIKVLVDAAQAKAGLDDAGSSASKMGKGIKAAALPAAAALAGVAAVAIKAGNAAAEDAQSQAILANTMEKTAGASSKQIAATEDWIAAMSKATGVADDELRPAMGSLMRATGDVATSQDALKQAMDISAATGKPLQSVADALAKGYGGQTTSLGRLLPGMDAALLKSGDMTAIMHELADATGGAAAAGADTAAGKMKIMQTQMGEAEESIGAALLPTMAKLASILAVVAETAAEHPAIFQAIAAAIVAFASAILIANLAMKVITISTQLFGATATKAWIAALGPIGLVILAIGLVVGALVLLYKKSETARKIMDAIWAAIKAAATAVATFMTRAFEVAWDAITGAAKATGRAVTSAWEGAKAAVVAVFHALENAWDATVGGIKALITTVTNFLTSAWEREVNGVKAIFRGLASVADEIFSAVKSAIGKVTTAFSELKGKITGVLNSAGSWLTQIGVNIVQGLVDGINSVIHWVQDAVQNLADKIPGWVKKRLGISSPSKVMAAIGRDIMAGLGFGMEQMTPEVEATAKAVSDRVTKSITRAFQQAALAELPKKATDQQRERALEKAANKAEKLSAKVLKTLRDEYEAINANTLARQDNLAALQEQQGILDQLTSQQQAYAESVTGSAKAYGALTTATLEEGEAFSAESLIANMAARLKAVQDFTAKLAQLRAMGLSEATLADLTAAGVETGGAMADALAAGGPAAVAEVNGMQAQLDTASTALGTDAAAGMYGAGVQAQQALVDGLALDQATLETAALTLANDLKTAVDKALKDADVQDSAQAFAEKLAKAIRKALRKALKKDQTGGGGGGGNDDNLLTSVPTVAGRSLAPVVAMPRASTTAAAPGGIHITVNGAVDPEATARQIQRILAGHDRRMGLAG